MNDRPRPPRPEPGPAPIEALVSPLDLGMHEIQVTLTLPAGALGQGAVLVLPAWTPGRISSGTMPGSWTGCAP